MTNKQRTMVNAVLRDTSDMLTGNDEEFARDLRRCYNRRPLLPKDRQRLEQLYAVMGYD